ncbi:MAG TPA: hypothetical protein VHR72_01980 [Gemmataceae bacterium]|nr:hypothetical protein [Gemmataceae bacterium]
MLFGFLAVSWLVAVFGLMAALCAFAFLSIRVRWLSPAAITLIHVHPRFVDALERQRRGESPLDVDGENNVPDLPHLKPDERIRR